MQLGCQLGNAPPIFFSVLPKRKRAVHGPKEKNAWRRTCACAQVCLKRVFSEFVPTKAGESSTGSRRSGQLRQYCAAIAGLVQTSGLVSKGLFF